MKLEETLALTPALSPRRGGSTLSSREFLHRRAWHRFVGTHGARTEAHDTGTLRLELGCLAALIVLLNLPLLDGACAVNLIFLPHRVAAGEWWRALTHPFVHVSWYHLILDATAFLLLYRELDTKKWFERFGYLATSGAGSLLVSLWAAPLVQTRGLCGLSGIAHGLMAVSGLEMIQSANDKTVERAGMLTFIIVITKSIVEAATGHVAFEALHLGDLGTPIAISHAGGVLGALGTWAITRRRDKKGKLEPTNAQTHFTNPRSLSQKRQSLAQG